MTIDKLLSPLVAFLLIFGFASPALAATFKLATIAPDGTTWMREMRAGAEQVAARTQGRVNFKFYPGGVMGNDASVLRKIRVGQLHGGAFTGGSLSQIYPDAQIYSLPMVFRNYDEARYVREKMDPLIHAGLAENGLELLGISEGGFAYVMSNQPFSGLADLRKQKVWVPEGDLISRTTLETAGIGPIPLPLGDVYTGLQTGLVDTVTAVPTGAIAFQWHTRVRHVADVPLAFLTGMLAVDQRRFNRLSESDRVIVREVFRAVFERLDALNREDNQQARQALIDAGVRFEQPSNREMSNWQTYADEAIDALSRKGVYTQSMLDQLIRHRNEYRELRTANGG